MQGDRLDELERRVAALERDLEVWRMRMRQVIGERYGIPQASAAGKPSAARDTLRRLADVVTGEGAIGRIGIGLLLLGLVFAVKYGIDRGWITEIVQVAIAALLGFVLLFLAQRIKESRPILARLLAGGGFAALYVSVFSAHAVYDLVPAGPGLVLASGVTAACFLVGTSRDDAAMAIVAVVGGLITPFVIRTGDADLPALVGYVTIVLAAAGLLYWRHGWRSLPVWSALSGIPVLILILVYLNEPDPIPLSWRWAAEGGLLVAVLLFVVAPLYRPSRRGLRPPPPPPAWLRAQAAPLVLPALAAVLGLSIWFMHRAVWSLEDVTWAGVGSGLALLLGSAWAGAWRSERRPESGALAVVAAVVTAFVFVDLFDVDGLSLAGWCAVLWASVAVAQRRGEAGGWIAAAALGVVLVYWLPERLSEPGSEPGPFLSWNAFGDAVAIGLLGLAARELPHRQLRLAGGAVAWICTLWLAGREFGEDWAVTTSWSVFAVALLASGRFGAAYRLAGMATVVLVVGKLLLFDLARLDELVRVGLFAGFGVVLLLVSYFFPSWWRGRAEPGEPEAADPDR